MAEAGSMPPGTGGALQGLVVIDLSRVLAGPLCTQVLADHGAQVIKVEPPAGDETRKLGPPFDGNGDAAYYLALNRGKQAISIDLALPEGREILLRLLERADVLVENFLPGTMERWGLGYEDALAPMYERLVYCTISGFGADGPLGGLPGYDAVAQAMCGLMSINGDDVSGPTRIGVPVVDHLTGYVALTGILMALQARSRTGRGQRVEATLFDTALSLLLPQAANYLASGRTPGLLGSAHPNIAPYDKFAASDGEVFIGIVNDGQFGRFCRHISRPSLATDPRFASNGQRLQHRDELRLEIESALQGRPASELCDELMRAGVPASVVNSVPVALAQPHATHRGSLQEFGQNVSVRSPCRLYGSPAIQAAAPPVFGADTERVLAGLGYTQKDIDRLRESGVVPGAPAS